MPVPQSTKIPDLKPFLEGNPNDILLIQNTDTNCDEVDSVLGWQHKDCFEWPWDGKPHRIVPGGQRRFPRWLAKHYAKHLADHVLGRMDKPINDAYWRPVVLGKIFIAVEELFDEGPTPTPGEKALHEVEDLNPELPTSQVAQEFGAGKGHELPSQDLGSMPDPTIGTLRPAKQPIEVKEAPKEQITFANQEELDKYIADRQGDKDADMDVKPAAQSSAKTPIWDKSSGKMKPTHKELVAEAEKLDLELTGKETVDQLIEMISKF